jgi:exodeoxyribonuclease VII small subunit
VTQQQPEEAPAAGPPDDASEGDARLSYEDARDELVAVVQRLENGGVSLQESVALWERGERLADVCQRWLDGARARLDAAMKDAE